MERVYTWIYELRKIELKMAREEDIELAEELQEDGEYDEQENEQEDFEE